MADTISGLSEREMADLCAFADGTLPAQRRAEIEARVAASPELRELVERQRISLAATRALASERPPASLKAGIEGRSRKAGRRRGRLALALSAAGVLAIAVTAFFILSLSGPATPSIADAAQLAIETPSGPPPATITGTMQLAVDVQGLPFPDLSREYGWRAIGVRRGRVGGRDATVVYYDKGGRRVGYVIVAGPALPLPGNGASTTLDGVEFQTLSLQGRPMVTWRRLGHTCVMIGAVPQAELLTLASWRGNSPEDD